MRRTPPTSSQRKSLRIYVVLGFSFLTACIFASLTLLRPLPHKGTEYFHSLVDSEARKLPLSFSNVSASSVKASSTGGNLGSQNHVENTKGSRLNVNSGNQATNIHSSLKTATTDQRIGQSSINGTSVHEHGFAGRHGRHGKKRNFNQTDASKAHPGKQKYKRPMSEPTVAVKTASTGAVKSNANKTNVYEDPWYITKDTKQRLSLVLNETTLPAILAYHAIDFPDIKSINISNYSQVKSKVILINTFRGGIKPLELDFARNMWVQTAAVGVEKGLLVASTTRITAVNAWRHGVPTYILNLTDRAGALASPDPTRSKWLLSAYILKAGYDVLFMDFDIGYRCNPLTLMHPNSDFMILDDYYVGGGCGTHHVSKAMCASTGFWIVRQAAGMVEFMWDVYERSAKVWEQEVINVIAPEYQLTKPAAGGAPAAKVPLRWTIVSWPLAVNIVHMKGLRNKPGWNESAVCLLHCGVTAGGEAKRDELVAEKVFSPRLFTPRTIELNGYGSEIVIPYFSPNRTDTIWL